MDSILIFMTTFGLFALLKFRKQPRFHSSWFLWLFTSVTFFSFGFCVKFVGLYSMVLAIIVVLYDLWTSLPDKSISSVKIKIIFSIPSNNIFLQRSLWMECFVYLSMFLIWPLIIYSTVFYIHLSILTKAGPHDNIMTSAFQASLEVSLKIQISFP